MNYKYYFPTDVQSCKNNIKSNKKIINICNYKSEYGSNQNLNDLGTSSSTLVTDIHTEFSNRLIHRSGSVDKRPLLLGNVKSSPCFEFVNCNDTWPMLHATHSRVQKSRSKITNHNIADDIDFIPVKLVSAEQNLNLINDKMKGLRQNMSRSTDRKVNSWGKILKEQNIKEPVVVKEQRKGSGLMNNISKNTKTTNVINRPLTVNQKHVTYSSPQSVNQVINSTKLLRPNSASTNSSDKETYKKSKHSKTNLIQNGPYSDSTSTISGESIMLIDRSVQCSSTNLMQDNKWQRNAIDVNQAGDSGLAFFNPIRTLNFLVRELRGKLSESSEDDNMARIIRDMENTISRLSSTAPHSVMDSNWSTLISEDDLKYVLDLLQTPIQIKPVVETDKNAVELQSKLEMTCSKLESMCTQMEKTACTKLREEKELLLNEVKEKSNQLEMLSSKLNSQEQAFRDLKKKTEEQTKIITSLKETNIKSSALNKILNEQLDDTEKKYEQLVTEMKFLKLEKMKNTELLKCKDKDLNNMRRNLDEIKTLVVEHLSTINIQETGSGENLVKENKLDLDNLRSVSALSLTLLQHCNSKKNDASKGIENKLPKCSSPTETISPSPEDDESWRKMSNVPLPTSVSHTQVPAQKIPSTPDKVVCVKESLKNIFEEMKKQTPLGKNLSVQNLINLDDPIGMSNWSDLEISEDEHSGGGFQISDTETNF